MIIDPRFPKTKKQYDQVEKANTEKLKAIMSKLVISESDGHNEAKQSKKVGKGMPHQHRTDIPIIYTNSSKAKKPKTFKL